MRHECLILADGPQALVELCGISLLERLLRTLQRLGLTKAIILSATPELIAQHLASRSPHRAKVAVDIRPRAGAPDATDQIADALPNRSEHILVLRGNSVFDSRLSSPTARRPEHGRRLGRFSAAAKFGNACRFRPGNKARPSLWRGAPLARLVEVPSGPTSRKLLERRSKREKSRRSTSLLAIGITSRYGDSCIPSGFLLRLLSSDRIAERFFSVRHKRGRSIFRRWSMDQSRISLSRVFGRRQSRPIS